MRAFIIRPFGTKNDINFDDVEQKLIDPALNRLGITGRTTMEIRRQGNIRLDMFQRLLTADLVIADISIHNANVYYELGVRHALRGKHTFMIRAHGADIKTDEVPFDIKTDRYLAYDGVNPAASVDQLVEGLRQTINSEAEDSPVFQMLPDLDEPDRSKFLPIPREYREEVERATQKKEVGDLELLAAEARGFEWETEGLRLVGRAQFNLKAFEGARSTWEAVRKQDALDVEANTLLGTIFQRLGDLTSSDQALRRVLSRSGLDRTNRAEVYSLLGRNSKSCWTMEWRQAESLPERQRLALVSPYLEESLDSYQGAFAGDLNHFYSGLNTLALLTIEVELAELWPQVWAERFNDEEEALRDLESRKNQIQKLIASTQLSLKATTDRLERERLTDVWVEISEADLRFLTTTKPNKVAIAYRKALAGAPDFVIDAVRRQLKIYEDLGLLPDNVAAVQSVLGPAPPDVLKAVPQKVLLFTGHMIDSPGREVPRFPPDKIEVARQAIKKAIQNELSASGGVAYGLAGCASGGDILFHEVCEEMGIPTRIFLVMQRDLYVRESVAPGGPEWVEKFNRLVQTHPVRVLCDSKELPAWLQDKPDYNIWQRNNLWNLHNALAVAGGENVTLIALWNGVGGDGPGGTADMVHKARERGAKTVILNTVALFSVVDDALITHSEESKQDPQVIASIVQPLFDEASQPESSAGQESAAPVHVTEKTLPEEADSFDVFISYNRSDQAVVQTLAKQLKEMGLRPWFDIWELRPGLPWQEEVEKQIAKIKSAAVFVGKGGMGPWQTVEQSGLLREFVDRQCPVIPVILPEVSDEPALPVFLKGMTWVDFRNQESNPMDLLIWGITGKRVTRKAEED